ncbi:MAG: DoxX family protein [Flavisolibacter sp.]|nr:DoxX family protein [Flavisolibacter sp.]
MEIFKKVAYWLLISYYIYLFGYASLEKVFQSKQMMDGMNLLGFNKTWTLLIGYGELVGWLIVLFGLYKPAFRNIGMLLLFPFAVGAFTAHMAHHEYSHYFNALYVTVTTPIMLYLDENFRIVVK